MIIAKIFSASGTPRSNPVQSLYKLTRIVLASLSLTVIATPFALTALMLISNLGPCGDTPGFCPY